MIYCYLFKGIYFLPYINFSLYNNTWQKTNPVTPPLSIPLPPPPPQQADEKTGCTIGKRNRRGWLEMYLCPKVHTHKTKPHTHKRKVNCSLLTIVLKLHLKIKLTIAEEKANSCENVIKWVDFFTDGGLIKTFKSSDQAACL